MDWHEWVEVRCVIVDAYAITTVVRQEVSKVLLGQMSPDLDLERGGSGTPGARPGNVSSLQHGERFTSLRNVWDCEWLRWERSVRSYGLQLASIFIVKM